MTFEDWGRRIDEMLGNHEENQDEERELLENEPPIGNQELFHVLDNERRRASVVYMDQVDLDEDEFFHIQEVAEGVACLVNEETLPDLDKDDYRSSYVSLYQSHIPKMEEADVITYVDGDQDRRFFPGPSFEYVNSVLQSAGDEFETGYIPDV